MIGIASCAFLATVWTAVSPDGKNEIRLMDEPTLSYSVLRDGQERVAPTPIGMKFVGRGALNERAVFLKVSKSEIRDRKVKSPLYKKAEFCEGRNETFVEFEGGWGVRLAARCDGVAYRFETSFGEGKVKVHCEKAGLNLPCGEIPVWSANEWDHWSTDLYQHSSEGVYKKRPAKALDDGTEHIQYLPIVVEYKDGVAMCVTESDLLDYPGLNLVREGGKTLAGRMAKLPRAFVNWDWDLGYTERLTRYIRVIGREDYIAETDATRTYPWRTFILAASPIKLCEADIVNALATPCRLKGDLSWIRPGKVAWDWWNCWNVSGVGFRAGVNTKTYEHYIDFAAENGVEYVIFDEGWSEKLNVDVYNPEMDVPHLVDYAGKKGVGIILWCAWAQLVGRQDQVFKRFADMGVKGFKIDFMDRDDPLVMRFYAETAEIAAKYRLVLDYHGMSKPTGLQRTYPNILNFEGVHGLEQCKFQGSANEDFPAVDLGDFYCRMTAGPMDYTPGAMNNMTKSQFVPNGANPGSQGTRVHQMALMSLFEAPLQMLCDSPTKYRRNQECLDYMTKVPVVWDETVGVAGDMEKYAVCARRSGDAWYLAAIGSWDAQEIDIRLDFLKDGEWTADCFEDGLNADRDATDYVRSTKAFKAGEALKLKLAPGGGFAARIVRK